MRGKSRNKISIEVEGNANDDRKVGGGGRSTTTRRRGGEGGRGRVNV